MNARLTTGPIFGIGRSSQALGRAALGVAHPRRCAGGQRGMIVIPPSLSSDPCEPRIPAEGPEALWGECAPCFAAGVDDGAVAVEQPMREEAFAQVEPDTLDRIWGTAPNAPGCRAAAERG
jgi:hypothetical protein